MIQLQQQHLASCTSWQATKHSHIDLYWFLLIKILRENTTSRVTTKRIQNNPRNPQSEKSKLSLRLIVSSNLTFSASDRQWFNMVLTLNPHNTLTQRKEEKKWTQNRKKKESEWFDKGVLYQNLRVCSHLAGVDQFKWALLVCLID